MRDNHLFQWIYVLLVMFFLFSSCTDGRGAGGGRGGGGRGGGFKGGSRGGGSSSFSKPRGSSFKSNALSFGAGAVGGIAAYSLMRSMSGSYHSRPGYYEAGYGTGETCTNNEDLNGTRFGSFRCPLNGFPYEAKSCCGEYGKQYCCIREGTSNLVRGTSSVGGIVLVIIIIVIVVICIVKRRQQKDVVMVPTDVPPEDQPGSPNYYHPQPPPMGYPPPPNVNPYAVPPQNYEGNFNPYAQGQQMPYPPQQQQYNMGYPPQQQQYNMGYPPQQQPYNPYPVKEGGPPVYNEAMRNNQEIPMSKPT